MRYDELLSAAPSFVKDNLCLLAFGGSISYGVNTNESDVDLVGFCIPEKKYVYQSGLIAGFDNPLVFDQFNQTGVDFDGKKTDITIYGLNRIAKLAYDGNPNIIEILFSKNKYIIEQNYVGHKIRSIAKQFISKRAVKKILGYATGEFKQVESRRNKFLNGIQDVPRLNLHEKYGYDTKSMGHAFRLLNNAIDMMNDGEIVSDRYKNYVSEIRTGKHNYTDMAEDISMTIEHVEGLLQESMLRDTPDFELIRSELHQIFHEFYLTHD
jgi:predicted nucleotidyltransferase